MKNRNIPLTNWPSVSHDTESDRIIVRTGTYRGLTRYVCKGELSLACAASLVKELRVSMRAIRAERIKRLDAAIEEAEQVLP